MRSFMCLLVVAILTIFLSWLSMAWMNFFYVGRMEAENSYMLPSWQYIGFLPTFSLFLISFLCGLVVWITGKLFFKNSLDFKYFSFLALFVFSFGIIGSFQGISTIKAEKCNQEMHKCLDEEMKKYSND